MTLYSKENCPRCKIMKMKLDKANIAYQEIHDIDKLIALGFAQAPILENNGVYYTLSDVTEKLKNGIEL